MKVYKKIHTMLAYDTLSSLDKELIKKCYRIAIVFKEDGVELCVIDDEEGFYEMKNFYRDLCGGIDKYIAVIVAPIEISREKGGYDILRWNSELG